MFQSHSVGEGALPVWAGKGLIDSVIGGADCLEEEWVILSRGRQQGLWSLIDYLFSAEWKFHSAVIFWNQTLWGKSWASVYLLVHF